MSEDVPAAVASTNRDDMTKIYEIGSCEWLKVHKNEPGVAIAYAEQIKKCKEIAARVAETQAEELAEKRRKLLENQAAFVRRKAGIEDRVDEKPDPMHGRPKPK